MQHQQQADKKKLQTFLSKMCMFGCVQGFKYFTTHLRGREELVCCVMNEPSLPILLSAATSPSSSFVRSMGRPLLPKEPESFLIGHKRQRRLSGYGYIDVGLSPASPASSEDNQDEETTMFLIAAYSRYGNPYVWVRSNHQRLVSLPEGGTEKDYPLQLQSTSTWSSADVQVWDVVAELVRVCTCPAPPNPFAVDMDYLESLSVEERVLASAALLGVLQNIITSGTHTYSSMVESDVLRVSRCHFQALLAPSIHLSYTTPHIDVPLSHATPHIDVPLSHHTTD